MSNLTVSVDDQLIKQARMRAIKQGTSLSAKVREFLQNYVNESEGGLAKQREQATARLMAAIEAAVSQKRPDNALATSVAGRRRTLRDEIYAGDFRAMERHATKRVNATKAPRGRCAMVAFFDIGFRDEAVF